MSYTTQMDAARQGIITKEMELVAKKERMTPEEVRAYVAKGQIAIPCNKNHTCIDPNGIGSMLKTKINVNLGTSRDCKDLDVEVEKVKNAVDMGAESIMDLSSFGDTQVFRRRLTAECPAIIGTVPIYDAVVYYHKALKEITTEEWLDIVRMHAEDGVDFMTIHCGINRDTAKRFKANKRLTNIVSRGGSIIFAWMEMTGKENPFYEHFDDILEICRKYDVTLSLGDACRPGCIEDASDISQIEELVTLGELTRRAWEKDVQVIIEGPGHMPLNQIEANMRIQKEICKGAPFYVLGPTSTIDLDCPTGADIPIEERDREEIKTMWYEKPMALPEVKCYNPAFDVTDHELIAGIVTEKGICRPPYTKSLKALFDDKKRQQNGISDIYITRRNQKWPSRNPHPPLSRRKRARLQKLC